MSVSVSDQPLSDQAVYDYLERRMAEQRKAREAEAAARDPVQLEQERIAALEEIQAAWLRLSMATGKLTKTTPFSPDGRQMGRLPYQPEVDFYYAVSNIMSALGMMIGCELNRDGRQPNCCLPATDSCSYSPGRDN